MVVTYQDILKQYGITEAELPEKAKAYIKRKHNSIEIDQRGLNSLKRKVNPEAPDEKLNKKIEKAEIKHAELIENNNEEINRMIVEVCEDIADEKQRAAEAAKQDQVKEQYDGIIARGDAALTANDFETAQAAYNEGLTLVPGDKYCTEQLTVVKAAMEGKKTPPPVKPERRRLFGKLLKSE